MIKVETLGMMNVARNNPVLKSDKDLVNNSFLVQDGITYLIDNVLTGDDSYRDGVVIPAGSLNLIAFENVFIICNSPSAATAAI